MHDKRPNHGGQLDAEFSWEVFSGLELAAFGDMGSLSHTSPSVFSGDGDLRYAVGTGLRCKLPIRSTREGHFGHQRVSGCLPKG